MPIGKTVVRGWILAGCGLAGLTLAACDNGGTVINPPDAPKLASAAPATPPAPVATPAVAETPTVDQAEVVTANTPTEPLPHYDIHFASGSADLSPAATTTLKTAVDYLQKYPMVQVKLSGFTDTAGPTALNQKLAQARARAAADFLKTNGIGEARIETAALGEGSTKNVPSGQSPGRWNRRVDVDFSMPPNS